MTSEMGQAVQIGQAVLTARDFASAMMDSLPQNVKVIYPSTLSTQYNSALGIIYIQGNSTDLDYFDWDVIMHEYGHHISHECNITDGPYLTNHDSATNNADVLNDKSKGVRLAWSESWPTIFGELAQQYFSSILVDITNVKDYAYSDTTNPVLGIDYDYDSLTDYLGEACERSIMAILWDLFDTTNEDGDTISL